MTHWGVGLVLLVLFWVDLSIALGPHLPRGHTSTGYGARPVLEFYRAGDDVRCLMPWENGSISAEATPLARVRAHFRKERHGLWAKTGSSWISHLTYTPYAPEQQPGFADPEHAMQQVVDAIEQWLVYTGYIEAIPDSDFVASITPDPRPMHASSVDPAPGALTEWGVFEQRANERTRWTGHIHNALSLGVFVWLVVCVRRFAREKPWRAWGKPAWRCRSCGYDLRNRPDGEPCPECGRCIG